jgi:hypothetical protein
MVTFTSLNASLQNSDSLEILNPFLTQYPVQDYVNVYLGLSGPDHVKAAHFLLCRASRQDKRTRVCCLLDQFPLFAGAAPSSKPCLALLLLASQAQLRTASKSMISSRTTSSSPFTFKLFVGVFSFTCSDVVAHHLICRAHELGPISGRCSVLLPNRWYSWFAIHSMGWYHW